MAAILSAAQVDRREVQGRRRRDVNDTGSVMTPSSSIATPLGQFAPGELAHFFCDDGEWFEPVENGVNRRECSLAAATRILGRKMS